jgi:hypothetical protein
MSRRPRATMPVGSLVYLNLREPPLAELRRIPLPRTPVNKGSKKRERAEALTVSTLSAVAATL